MIYDINNINFYIYIIYMSSDEHDRGKLSKSQLTERFKDARQRGIDRQQQQQKPQTVDELEKKLREMSVSMSPDSLESTTDDDLSSLKDYYEDNEDNEKYTKEYPISVLWANLMGIRGERESVTPKSRKPLSATKYDDAKFEKVEVPKMTQTRPSSGLSYVLGSVDKKEIIKQTKDDYDEQINSIIYKIAELMFKKDRLIEINKDKNTPKTNFMKSKLIEKFGNEYQQELTKINNEIDELNMYINILIENKNKALKSIERQYTIPRRLRKFQIPRKSALAKPHKSTSPNPRKSAFKRVKFKIPKEKDKLSEISQPNAKETGKAAVPKRFAYVYSDKDFLKGRKNKRKRKSKKHKKHKKHKKRKSIKLKKSKRKKNSIKSIKKKYKKKNKKKTKKK